MNVIVLLAATAILTTFLSFAPMTAAQGKQIYAPAGSDEEVSARRRSVKILHGTTTRKEKSFPKLAVR